jgi:hypothetical protein
MPVAVKLFFVVGALVTFVIEPSTDFRLVGGRIGALVRDEYTIPSTVNWLASETRPGPLTGGVSLSTTYGYDGAIVPYPPTVLIYEFDVEALAGNFTKAQFANVVRLVSQRTGLVPNATATEYDGNYWVATYDRTGNVIGRYIVTGNNETLDRDVIAHLIPWSDVPNIGRGPSTARTYQPWQPTERYFNLMIRLLPKWITSLPRPTATSFDDVRKIAMWEGFFEAGFPRDNTLNALAWHATGQRLAYETGMFIPVIYARSWKPLFPSSIKVIEDRAMA